jgi:hypothetical protein
MDAQIVNAIFNVLQLLKQNAKKHVHTTTNLSMVTLDVKNAIVYQKQAHAANANAKTKLTNISTWFAISPNVTMFHTLSTMMEIVHVQTLHGVNATTFPISKRALQHTDILLLH